MEEACRAVRAARVEASSAINGIGVVNVMGRSSGFIASNVSLASGDVDLCLLPEVRICLDGGELDVFEHVRRVLKEKGYAVVLVAEGAGEDILGKSAEKDAGGNRKLPPIGPWIKERLSERIKEALVRYIDPSYMIRSVPANGSDNVYCVILSQNAAHAAMAGFTDACVGLVNQRTALIPMEDIINTSPRALDVSGRTYEGVCSVTNQPYSVKEITEACAASTASAGVLSTSAGREG